MIENIDWCLLRKHKQTLLKIINQTSDPQDKEDLTGILHLIDGLQDEAVEEGFPEEDIFEGCHDDDDTLQAMMDQTLSNYSDSPWNPPF